MYPYIKRIFDFTSALALLIVISPLFLVLMLLVRIKIGSPVFFTQERTGKDMKNFKLIKFRTMTNDTDKDGRLLPDHDRLLKLGKFLRSSSLDELPELLNIIKGDMSVIGPRPLPPVYNGYYRENEKSRFNVRGGLITPDCIDQDPIITWDKQLDYEATYGSDLTFNKDLKIFFAVFRILFQRQHQEYGAFERASLSEERELK